MLSRNRNSVQRALECMMCNDVDRSSKDWRMNRISTIAGLSMCDMNDCMLRMVIDLICLF